MGGKDTKGTTVGTGNSGTPSWDLKPGQNVGFNKDNASNVFGHDLMAVYNQGPQALNTYAGLSGTTNQGLAGLLSNAKANTGYMNDATKYTQNLIDRGGLTSGQTGNINAINNIGKQYGNLAAKAGSPSLTEGTLMGVAKGQYLNGANPYFEQNLAQATDAARTAVNSSIGGRYGSNIHTQDLTQNVGNLENSARGAQYETERDRQLQALGAIEGTRQQGFGNQLSALGAQSGNASQAFNMGQTGVGNTMNAGNNLASLYQASTLPYKDMLAAGQVRDADAQAQLNAQNTLKNADYNHLAQYMGLLQGTAANKEKPNPFMDFLGTAGNLASLFL